MENVKLTEDFEISRLVHGHWRSLDWGFSDQELLKFTEQIIELGITSFDHADIYGNYECEKQFGKALALNKKLRDRIQIISKCGIKLISDKFPERKVAHYDYSYEHIIKSAENSLKNFKTDYIDLFLLHRPSPFFNPEEVAKAFSDLQKSGKVLHFGVSNFTAQQFKMLSNYVDKPLITNQVELSPYCLEHYENGNMDFFLEQKIKPMAWSPLAGGKLIKPTSKKEKRLHECLLKIAKEIDADHIESVIFSWLFKHPSTIIPIMGTGKISRIKTAVQSSNTELSLEQWMEIYIASKGERLP